MEIEIINTLECKIGSALAKILRPILSYTAVYYQQTKYRKIRREYLANVMNKVGTNYYFYLGLLDKVLSFCKENNIPIKITGEIETLSLIRTPKLNTKVLREEQIRLVTAATERQRGVLVAPTGTGKSAMGIAIISAFLGEETKALWLCHTKDLMYQAARVAKEELGISPGFIGNGITDYSQSITMATRQSFIKVARDIGHLFDILIYDEAHHCQSKEAQNILTSVLAPVRIGLTATLPTDIESLLRIEGLIGPVIEKVTVAEGQERGSMAKVKLKIVKLPMSYSIHDLKAYKDVYRYGVVEREAQHEACASIAFSAQNSDRSVLILVSRIEHGENILEVCLKKGVHAVFAQGKTESDVRAEILRSLSSKEQKVVIATTIFKEGIDVPSLDILINAAGGKSEIATLQAIGRGLRTTETKKEVTVVDFFDNSHSFLVNHFGERLCLYSDLGWL